MTTDTSVQVPPAAVTPAQQQGRDAYFAGVVAGDVPFAEHTGEHWDWLLGWSEAGLADTVAKRRRAKHFGR